MFAPSSTRHKALSCSATSGQLGTHARVTLLVTFHHNTCRGSHIYCDFWCKGTRGNKPVDISTCGHIKCACAPNHHRTDLRHRSLFHVQVLCATIPTCPNFFPHSHQYPIERKNIVAPKALIHCQIIQQPISRSILIPLQLHTSPWASLIRSGAQLTVP